MATATSDEASDERNIWNQINRELVSLKLLLVREEIGRIEQQYWATTPLGNYGEITLVAIMGALVLCTHEELNRIYQAYCEVWTSQGHSKSAAFVRVVHQHVIIPQIEMRRSAMSARWEPIVTGSTEPITESLSRIAQTWENKLEIEARECEHRERAMKLTSAEVGVAVMADEAAANLHLLGKPEPFPSAETPVLRQRKSPYRSRLKRAIHAALLRNPNSTDQQGCSLIDENDWTELGGPDRTLTSGFKDPQRRRILQVTISKVRRDMREQGLL